jgi:hypothetical protein
LSLFAVGAPAHGTAVLSGATVLYTPTVNFFGAEVFTYTVTDCNGGYATTSVTVTVSGLPDAPQAVDDVFSVDEDSRANWLYVRLNDHDVDGDPLSIVGVGLPDNGGGLINNGALIVYSPAAGFVGARYSPPSPTVKPAWLPPRSRSRCATSTTARWRPMRCTRRRRRPAECVAWMLK